MKVGDYVRTPKGISKITSVCEYGEDIVYTDTGYGFDLYYVKGKEFPDGWYKYSKNIIDLIEVGDYVNGYKVTMLEDKYYDNVTDSVKKIKDKEKIKIILGNEEQFYGVYAKDIKSIVTKEQFKSMEYKIGE